MGVDDSSADIIVGHIFCVLLIWKAVMAIAIFKKNCIDKSEKKCDYLWQPVSFVYGYAKFSPTKKKLFNWIFIIIFVVFLLFLFLFLRCQQSIRIVALMRWSIILWAMDSKIWRNLRWNQAPAIFVLVVVWITKHVAHTNFPSLQPIKVRLFSPLNIVRLYLLRKCKTSELKTIVTFVIDV